MPVTSKLCKWNVPKGRKNSSLSMMESTFTKHEYSKAIKRPTKRLDEFDPRPQEFRGTACQRLPELLKKLRGKQLGISLLLDPLCRNASDEIDPECKAADNATLRETCAAFKKSLCLSDQEIRETELRTREQRMTPFWYSARQYRITASQFGVVYHRKDSTPPDKLVLQLIQRKSFSTLATRYGIEMEPVAIEAYVQHQHNHGLPDLVVTASGFHVSSSHTFLGATPDGSVYDPHYTAEPFGFLEVKCPFSAKDVEPYEACTKPNFFSTVNKDTNTIELKESHSYYCQVQGQMEVGKRQWCDFVIYTQKGISVQRITFNERFWTDKLLPKLERFYNNCLLPELVSPVNALGLPIRDLSKSQ